MRQKIVITGGPSTGKTTLINELKARGFECIPEISRQVTLTARAEGIEYLFLENPLLFSERLLEGRERQYLEALEMNKDLIFFDRGIPDIHAYMNHFGTDYPSLYIEKSKTYTYDAIFLLPPWSDIYENDNERFESFDLSVAIYNQLKEAYTALNYEVIEVPFGAVASRVNFILENLGQMS